MIVLVVLVIVLVAVVLVVRSAQASGRPGARPAVRRRRAPRRPSGGRPVAPDDDPDFLRELERRAKREDGSTGA